MFDYEQVLVVAGNHAAKVDYVKPRQLGQEVLISYPVPFERLDIYNQFLLPAGITPRRHKAIETTDIMMQMVASGRGVAAMPRWLVEEYAARMDVVPVRLGAKGIPKQIYLGAREADTGIDYLQAFIELARNSSPLAGNVGSALMPAGLSLRADAFINASLSRSDLHSVPGQRMMTRWPPRARCARSASSRCRISRPAASGRRSACTPPGTCCWRSRSRALPADRGRPGHARRTVCRQRFDHPDRCSGALRDQGRWYRRAPGRASGHEQ